jgi:Lsr2
VTKRRTCGLEQRTLLIEDLDDSDTERTVRFRPDGTEYEIDLNAGHAQALRDAQSPCACGAAGRGRCAAARPARSPPAGVADSTGVREWANAQGIEVKDRGRVPAGLVARFMAAALKVTKGTARSRCCGATCMCARSDGL